MLPEKNNNELMAELLEEKIKLLDKKIREQILNDFLKLTPQAKKCVNQLTIYNLNKNDVCPLTHEEVLSITDSCLFVPDLRIYHKKMLKRYLFNQIRRHPSYPNQQIAITAPMGNPFIIPLNESSLAPLSTDNESSRRWATILGINAFLYYTIRILDKWLKDQGMLRKNASIFTIPLKSCYDYIISQLFDINRCITSQTKAYPSEQIEQFTQSAFSSEGQVLTACKFTYFYMSQSRPYPDALQSSPTYYQFDNIMEHCIKNLNAVKSHSIINKILSCHEKYHELLTDSKFEFIHISILMVFLLFYLMYKTYRTCCKNPEPNARTRSHEEIINTRYNIGHVLIETSQKDLKEALTFNETLQLELEKAKEQPRINNPTL